MMLRQLRHCAFFLICISIPAFGFDSIQLKKIIPAPVSAKAAAPTGIGVGPTGRLWVSDSVNHQLFSLSADGQLLQTIGRRGAATGEFENPHGVAVDSDGRVYVADSGNQRIQVFDAEGKFLDAFGQKGSDAGQFRTPWQIAVSRDQVLVISDKDSTRVQLFSKDGVFLHAFDVGAAIDGLTVDTAGRIYTAHSKSKQIEQWSSAGQHLRTITGIEPGVKGFSKPRDLAVTPSGLLYAADPDAEQFRELDAAGHTLGVFGRAGSGDGQFKIIDGIAALNETVYVCDSKLRRITVLALARQTPLPAMAPVPLARLQVSRQAPLAYDVDRLAWNSDGTLHTLSIAKDQLLTHDLMAKTTTTIDLKAMGIQKPSGLTTAPASGSLFISDSGNDRVVKADRQGKVLLEFGKSAGMFKSGQGEVSNPQGLACSTQGVLFIADTGNNRFQAFNHQGLFQLSGGEKGSGPGQLKTPTAIAWDKDRVYVADTGNRKVASYGMAGRFLRETGVIGPETLVEPKQIAVDREGNLFVLDAARGRLLAYDAQGVYLGGFGSTGKTLGFLNGARDFALNDSGDLYVAEEGRIQAFRVVLLPPAPVGVQTKSGEGYVTISWDPAKTRFPPKYIVYRSTPLGAVERVKDTVDTSATDDTLLPNTTYTYTVVAQSVQGATSVPSAPVTASAQPLKSGPRVEIVSTHIDDVFSAHYKYYGRVPLGKVTIRNNSLSPVQKVKVSFAIQGYMDYPTETPIPELRSMEEKDIPLLATFNNRILEVTETTPIQAQVKVTFYSGDAETAATRNLPFKLYSRNTIRWDNKDRFAAFVTPNDPAIIEFSRAVTVPFADGHRGAPVPHALLTAWSVFSGLSTYGISYLPRPNNPYDRVSLDSSTVDSLQFARETLIRKSGDCADVVALLASALESLTVTTCALDAPGHLFLMFDTGETQKEALGLPDPMVVNYGGSYWIPIEATMLGTTFTEAWKQGAEEYRRLAAQNKVHPIDTHNAWRTFEPATLPEVALGAKAPTREAIEEKFLADWKALVDLRWQTSVAAAKQASAQAPESGAPWLRLGLLAVEYKRFEEAKDYFSKAQEDPKTAASARNNLGNLAMLRGDLDMALSLYNQAAEKDPSDAQIYLNLARLHLKQAHPQKASAAYEKAVGLDHSLREQYPDVSALGL